MNFTQLKWTARSRAIFGVKFAAELLLEKAENVNVVEFAQIKINKRTKTLSGAEK